MRQDELTVNFVRTMLDQPLAVVDGLPGGGAEFTPDDLRELARTLNQIADHADERYHISTKRVYMVTR